MNIQSGIHLLRGRPWFTYYDFPPPPSHWWIWSEVEQRENDKVFATMPPCSEIKVHGNKIIILMPINLIYVRVDFLRQLLGFLGVSFFLMSRYISNILEQQPHIVTYARTHARTTVNFLLPFRNVRPSLVAWIYTPTTTTRTKTTRISCSIEGDTWMWIYGMFNTRTRAYPEQMNNNRRKSAGRRLDEGGGAAGG